MSLAREKFLKRKRELLGNVNISESAEEERATEEKIDVKQKVKNERENDETGKKKIEISSKGYRGETKRKEQEETYYDERYNEYDDNSNNNRNKGKGDLKNKKNIRNESNFDSLDGKEEGREFKRTNSKWNKYETTNTNYYNNCGEKSSDKKSCKQIKSPNRPLNQLKKNSLYDNGNILRSNDQMESSSSNIFSEINTNDDNRKEGKCGSNNDADDDERKTPFMKLRTPTQSVDVESLIDINNLEINNSADLLIYVCKLILRMCGDKWFSRNSVNTSFTSVEILREIKSKYKKNVKLLKINMINEILLYLSKGSVSSSEENVNGSTDEYINKEDIHLFKKHNEIKIGGKCIETENIGITVIIKKVYLKNVMHLLYKCMHSKKQNENTKNESATTRMQLSPNQNFSLNPNSKHILNPNPNCNPNSNSNSIPNSNFSNNQSVNHSNHNFIHNPTPNQSLIPNHQTSNLNHTHTNVHNSIHMHNSSHNMHIPKDNFMHKISTPVAASTVTMTSTPVPQVTNAPFPLQTPQPITHSIPQQMLQSVAHPPPPPPLLPPPPPPPSIKNIPSANGPLSINRSERDFVTESDQELIYHVDSGSPTNASFSGLLQNNLQGSSVGNQSGGAPSNEQDVLKMKEGSSNKNQKINYLENLLNEPTAKEKKRKEEKTNILSILEAPTVIEEMRIKKFQKKNDSVKIICPHLTKSICQKYSRECNKIHFKKIISEHTDVTLGDCSYLDTCRHIETCKFVHYAVDKDDQAVSNLQKGETQDNSKSSNGINNNKISLYSSLCADQGYAPQWIQCDLRNFDLSIFNQYVSVVMADPPWDIHMDLPYGTMTDNEMKHLPVQLIQDEGMIFLWVTGRAMELARECLQIWGYKRVEEILWVKTNHLQRIIRTGRTGHWLNHSKEHCLVGVKGNPVVNRNIDCNVIVSEVRETSRKPDEIYSIIERLCPQNLKLELFGRPHNCRNNWITLGNQLNGVVLHHPQIKERYNRSAAHFNLPLCE